MNFQRMILTRAGSSILPGLPSIPKTVILTPSLIVRWTAIKLSKHIAHNYYIAPLVSNKYFMTSFVASMCARKLVDIEKIHLELAGVITEERGMMSGEESIAACMNEYVFNANYP